VKPTHWRFIKLLGDLVGARAIQPLDISQLVVGQYICCACSDSRQAARATGKIDPPGCRESVASAIRQYAGGPIKAVFGYRFSNVLNVALICLKS